MENNQGKILERTLSDEMKDSFLDYAMSVIVARALPDVRDGLKPVHRRILHAMNEMGNNSDKPYKKSARTVGEVIGKYHPHGDSAVYETMVRMAQDFSYRYELVDGHGNFGSVDGDSAAAMRYTEARMSKIAEVLLKDIKKNTVDFIPNYDGSEFEPSVLPSKFPNILINGGTGIAVGMATNIPPHNMGEVIDGVLHLIDNPEVDTKELMNFIKGPDFPTSALILGQDGIYDAYSTGKGSIAIRSRVEIEEYKNGKSAIIVSEIPYQVNKSKLIQKIAELTRDKKIDGITDLRDESNREGIRILIELRRDVNPEVILNHLYKATSLQTTFSVNSIVLDKGQPKLLNLKDMLMRYFEHQKEVILRRTKFELEKAEKRIHILEGMIIALNNLDFVIQLIKKSETSEIAKKLLMDRLKLSEIQASAILDMKLNRLTGLETEKIKINHAELEEFANDLKDILANPERVNQIIKEELLFVKEKYNDVRRSEITDSVVSIQNEDLIEKEDIVITVTETGYVKRLPVDEYKSQKRGGVGSKNIKTKEIDNVKFVINCNTHDDIYVFSSIGKVYKIKGYTIPEGVKTSKGTPFINLINIDKSETVMSIIPVNIEEKKFLLFGTKKGIVKKTEITKFGNIRSNGLIAINLRDCDELINVISLNDDNSMMIATSNGKAIHIKASDIRSVGRSSFGVKGISLADDNYVVAIEKIISKKAKVLSISENGYGKLTSIDEYRIQNRGGKGITTIKCSEKVGKLANIEIIDNLDDDVLVTTNNGIIIRTPIIDISESSRVTQGVRIIRTKEKQKIVGTTILKQAVIKVEEKLGSENE